MALLEVKNLHVRYGGAEAVRGIDLTVDEGEIAVVLGSNGAGKTSTLRAILRQVPSSGGTIRWDGVEVARWPTYRLVRSGITMVPEGRRVFAPLTVRENLLVGAHGSSSKNKRQVRLEQVFSLFPILLQRCDQAAGFLSGGEQQMLAFGRAMMAEPRVVLMDEPSMGLSPAMVDVVMESIQAISATGIGILMVEQNATAALGVAERAVVLERGSIVLSGSSEEIRKHPDVVKAFLGDRAAAQ